MVSKRQINWRWAVLAVCGSVAVLGAGASAPGAPRAAVATPGADALLGRLTGAKGADATGPQGRAETAFAGGTEGTGPAAIFPPSVYRRDPNDANTVRARTSAGHSCPWLKSGTSVATRVTELVAAMTPLQEATMLHLMAYTPTNPYEGWSPAIPTLCIPEINEQDGSAGVGNGYSRLPDVSHGFAGATQLPAPIADAAAFDPTLAGSYGSVIGAEDAAKGVDMALAPTINIDRSPLWGRSYETLGEDPYLTASLAVPLVNGIQANRVVSVVKHFAVYNQETRAGHPARRLDRLRAGHAGDLPPGVLAVVAAGQPGRRDVLPTT